MTTASMPGSFTTACQLSCTRSIPNSWATLSDEARERFKADMETLLLHTGWSFVGFTPERRNRGDRRSFPRITERRRWWTDGWLFYS